MSDETPDEPQELAERAGRHARDAAKDGAKAVRAAAEPAVEAIADEARDTADKLEGTAQDVVDKAKRVDPRVLSRISSDAGQGLMALSVAIWAGTLAVNKLRVAYAGRKAVMTRPID